MRNRALAEVTRADDFIVSDKLVSLTDVAVWPRTRSSSAVFDDLFDEEAPRST